MIIPRLERDPVELYGRRSRWQLEQRVDVYRETGSLYGADYEALEASNIREQCEQLGIPMGYGRVGKVPTQVPGWQPREALAPTDTLGRRGRVNRRRKRAPAR